LKDKNATCTITVIRFGPSQIAGLKQQLQERSAEVIGATARSTRTAGGSISILNKSWSADVPE
jgi:hypothetical protein